MATLAHALQLVGTWIAPLTIFLLRPNSRFVRFHALQALLLQIVYMSLWICAVAVFVGTMVTHLPHSGSPPQAAPPTALMVIFPIFWIFGMGSWAVMLVIAIMYALKAGRGEWAGYPLIGKLARKLLHM